MRLNGSGSKKISQALKNLEIQLQTKKTKKKVDQKSQLSSDNKS